MCACACWQVIPACDQPLTLSFSCCAPRTPRDPRAPRKKLSAKDDRLRLHVTLHLLRQVAPALPPLALLLLPRAHERLRRALQLGNDRRRGRGRGGARRRQRAGRRRRRCRLRRERRGRGLVPPRDGERGEGQGRPATAAAAAGKTERQVKLVKASPRGHLR